jgi:hypothetical protein
MLLDSGGEREEAALLAAFSHREGAEAALARLVEHKLVSRREGIIELSRTDSSLDRANKIIEFYRGLQRVNRRHLLFRGILNTTQYKCLIHRGTFFQIMDDEGFAHEEVEELMTTDGELGYIEHLKIVYRAKDGVTHKFFSFIPLYYYPHFIVMNNENVGPLRARLQATGVQLIEEDYLLGHYPIEIVNQSREYIRAEKEYIRERIKNEAFDIWWYYRF